MLIATFVARIKMNLSFLITRELNTKTLFLCVTIFIKKNGNFDGVNLYWYFPKKSYYDFLEAAKEFSHIIKIEPIKKAKISVEFYMHDDTHFSVHFCSSRFKIEKFIEIIEKREINYRQENGLLIFDLNSYEDVMKKVIAKFEKCTLLPLPDGVVELFKKKREAMDHINMDSIEKIIAPALFNQLKDFQKQAVLYAIQNDGRLL